jgi:hypothetical protein
LECPDEMVISNQSILALKEVHGAPGLALERPLKIASTIHDGERCTALDDRAHFFRARIQVRERWIALNFRREEPAP